MDVPVDEIYRYLAMGRAKPDPSLAARVESVRREILAAARPAFVSLAVDVRFGPDGGVALAAPRLAYSVKSATLARALSGCSRAFLFAATIGAGVDLLLRRWSQTSPADALIGQAAGAAAIESYCDEVCARLADTLPAQSLPRSPSPSGRAPSSAFLPPAISHQPPANLFLRARFSPGYGDFPLAAQRPLLDALDASRRAGISLTDTLLMTPSKSVSALVGFSSKPCSDPAGCAACDRRVECPYAKGTLHGNS